MQAQRKQVQAHTLTLKLKTADFHILTRSQTYSSVLPHAAALEQAARQLAQRMPTGRDYRLIGLGISHLLPQGSQPELWAEEGTDVLHRKALYRAAKRGMGRFPRGPFER